MSPKSGKSLIYNRERFCQNQNFIKASALFTAEDNAYTPLEEMDDAKDNNNLDVNISQLKNIVNIKNQ